MNSLGSLLSIVQPPQYEQRIQEYAPDDIIGGRYLILKQNPYISGHGHIFFCHDLWDKCPCVLKEIHASKYEEATRFATLPFHENIVKLRRLEVIGGSILLVQDWLPDTLANHMNAPRSRDEIEHIILSVCRGLGHCIRHLSPGDRVFVHGDIKPENLLLSTDGTIKLADFGFGYTPVYASPEQLRHEQTDQRSDIFSIGVLLGKLCVNCTDPAARIKLEAVADKCQQQAPEDRFQSVEELYRELAGADLEYAESCGLAPAQLCNLAKIGQRINVFQLFDRLPSADAEELCDIAEAFVNMGLTSNAIQTYGMSLRRKDNARAFAGLAKSYSMAEDWDGAIGCSQEALKRNPTDYRSMYTHINALYNKAVQGVRLSEMADGTETTSAFIDYAPNASEIRRCFAAIGEALETIRRKYPRETEPLRLLGYIHAILGDDEKVIRYDRDYLAKVKDDYESAFLYAVRLYFSNDLTESMKQFRKIGDFLENAESVSLNRGITLLQCRYFSNDFEGFDRALTYLEPILAQIPEAKTDVYENKLLRFALIKECFEYDCDAYDPWFSILNKIARQLRAGAAQDPDWCRNQLRLIEQYREEWSGLRFSGLSFAYRKLNLLSYDYASYLYNSLGDQESALDCVEKMLEYDHSMYNAHYNKAVILVNLGRYAEAIPVYRRLYEMETDPEQRRQLKQSENELLAYLYEEPDSFFEMLLRKSGTWYGGQLLELESMIRDYRILFSALICNWLSDYAGSMIDRVVTGSLRTQAFGPLFMLLEELHDVSLHDFGEDEPVEIVIPMGGGLSCVYRAGKASDLTEYILPVLELLIKAAESYGISDLLFNGLRLRGRLYDDRRSGDRMDNLNRALADLNRLLALPQSESPQALPQVTWAFQYIGKILVEMDRPEKAEPYLTAAMNTYHRVGDSLNEGRVHLSRSIGHFKEKDLRNAALEASQALRCITLEEEPTVFARANYILGLVSVITLGPKREHVRERLDEGIDSFEHALLAFREHSAEWFVSVGMIGYLYGKKNELFHEGNWALAEYYRNKASGSGLMDPDTVDFLGARVSVWQKYIANIPAL